MVAQDAKEGYEKADDVFQDLVHFLRLPMYSVNESRNQMDALAG